MPENSIKPYRENGKKWIYLFLAVAIPAILALALFSLASGSIDPYITKQQEKFTELFFTDYDSLPKIVDAGKSLPVDFAIVNHEGHDETYSYSVTIIEDSVSAMAATETLELQSEGLAQRQFIFTPAKAGKKYEIVIELLDRSQRIKYSTQSKF